MNATSTPRPRIVLASASPRRAALLVEAGYEVQRLPADLDDADLRPHRVDPIRWVVAMAWLKAARVRTVMERTASRSRDMLLAADTVCDCDGEMLGKPRDRGEAEAMLGRLLGRSHLVHTGVCVVELKTGRRRLAVDTSTVTLGPMGEHAVRSYLDSGEWAGKAGGYNYGDRLAAGWPLTCDGDPTSVMGLPMTRLVGLLEPFEESAS